MKRDYEKITGLWFKDHRHGRQLCVGIKKDMTIVIPAGSFINIIPNDPKWIEGAAGRPDYTFEIARPVVEYVEEPEVENTKDTDIPF